MSVDPKQGFSSGLQNRLRNEIESYGDVNSNNGAAVFWVGVVMDDKDELAQGRLWVYLPGYNSSSTDEAQFPSWKGTVPDKRGEPDTKFDTRLRYNWIMCWPANSYFGSDEFRAEFTNDGRNAYSGNVNSYGDWYQPRIGDHVSVLMMNGDPSRAYYTGCMTKMSQNGMVPGLAGSPREQIVDSEMKDRTKDGAQLPGYDNKASISLPKDGYDVDEMNGSPRNQVIPGSVNTAPSDPTISPTSSSGISDFGPTTGSNNNGSSNQAETRQLPISGASKNTILGGVAYDEHRGAGSSSSRRESPSYVSGRKTPGWNFDTEQFNSNAHGSGRFIDQKEKYRHKNTTGHQMIMDDHPDSQMMRFRTSGGAQVLMNDSGSSPYIMISTAKGNVWMELADDGNIQIYAEESISLHSKKDISLTADRCINMEAGKDINVFAHIDYRHTSGADSMYAINGGLSMMVLAGKNEHIQGGSAVTIQGPYSLTVTSTYAMKAANYSDCITGNHISDASGSRYQMSGDIHSLQASSIWINSGITAEHEDPEPAKLPKFPELTKKPGVPTQSDIEQNERAEKVKYLAGKVPQHQPWPGRTGMDTAGTNGQVGPELIQSDGTPELRDSGTGGTIGSCDASSASGNVRNGAASPNSKIADTVVGSMPGSIPEFDYVGMAFSAVLSYLSASTGQGHLNGVWNGNPYETEDQSEYPSYTIQRYLSPGEVAPASGFTVSTEMYDYIKTHNGLTQYVVVGLNNELVIGYGHQIELNETVGGTTFTAPVIQEFVRTGGENKLTYVSIEQADQIFQGDLEEVEKFLWDNVTGSITQQQFDALASFIFNVGIDRIQNGDAGTDVVKALNVGRTDVAVARISNHIFVNGVVDPNTVARRRDERELMGERETDYITYGEIPVSGLPIQVGQFLVDPAVKDAIDGACVTYEVDPKFAYVMCAQLSGFNPTAENTRSGSKGLFMISPAGALIYGITGDEFDISQNSLAGIRYISDAAAEFEYQNEREPTSIELYTSMFLGQAEGAQYAKIIANNPNGSAANAVDSLVAGLSAQYKPLFFYGDGTPRTNTEFVSYLNSVLTERLASFT